MTIHNDRPIMNSSELCYTVGLLRVKGTYQLVSQIHYILWLIHLTRSYITSQPHINSNPYHICS